MRLQLHPDRPPGRYPHDLEREVNLSGGGTIFIRPVVPTDADVLASEILAADNETLYQRFFTIPVEPDAPMLERLTVFDYRSALALGCFDVATGEPVGIARYAEIDADAVEVAVAVKRGWRRRGVATLLLDLVEEAAARAGYAGVVAFHLGENEPAGTLFATRGYRVVGAERGVLERVGTLGAGCADQARDRLEPS